TPAALLDRFHQRIDHGDRSTFNVPELLLHHAPSRAPDAANARPYPKRRNVVRVLIELVIEEWLPKPPINSFAAPAHDPGLGRFVLDRRPMVLAHRDQRKQAVSQLLP